MPTIFARRAGADAIALARSRLAAGLGAGQLSTSDPPAGQSTVDRPRSGVFDPGRRPAAALVGVAVVAAAVTGLLTFRSRPQPVLATAPATVAAPARPSAPAARPLVIAVAGKVRHPGVVNLPAGARVQDAVRAAGGILPGTDLGLLNLARRLTDGELVVVGSAAAAAVPGSAPGSTPGTAGALLDLNAATAEQLDELPGVGPVLADRIVDYRTTHGPFATVDQLRDVEGIGDAKFAQLRPRVTV